MKAPLRLPQFRRLISAYGINLLGTWVGEIALAILVLHETGSAAAVAAVWTVGMFLPSLAGPLLVARLERVPTKVVLPALLAAEAALTAGLAVVAASGFSLPWVLALATADGIAALVARALLKAAVVATTEPRGQLREGNALFTVVFTTSLATGPLLGGVLVGLASVEIALLLDAASFALAALLLTAHASETQLSQDEQSRSGRLREGLAYVRAHGGLRPLFFACAAVAVLGSAILPLEVVLVTDTLGGGEAAYGTVVALWGGGAVAGSALLPVLRRVPLRPLLAGSFAVYAVSYLGMGTAGSVEVVAVFSLFGGISNGIEVYATTTAIQELTSDEQQARVNGFVESVVAAGTGAGFLVGGVLASIASARAVYIVAGLGMIAVAALLVAPRWLAPAARRLRAPRAGLTGFGAPS